MAVRFARSRLAALLLCAGLTSVGAHADSAVSYTYTALSQVASVDGPRTDVSDVTQYAYDAQGNLTTVTNALGQVTTLANFDSYGHPQTVTDPNGVVVTLTYTPEGGWPTARWEPRARATATTPWAMCCRSPWPTAIPSSTPTTMHGA